MIRTVLPLIQFPRNDIHTQTKIEILKKRQWHSTDPKYANETTTQREKDSQDTEFVQRKDSTLVRKIYAQETLTKTCSGNSTERENDAQKYREKDA